MVMHPGVRSAQTCAQRTIGHQLKPKKLICFAGADPCSRPLAGNAPSPRVRGPRPSPASSLAAPRTGGAAGADTDAWPVSVGAGGAGAQAGARARQRERGRVAHAVLYEADGLTLWHSLEGRGAVKWKHAPLKSKTIKEAASPDD